MYRSPQLKEESLTLTLISIDTEMDYWLERPIISMDEPWDVSELDIGHMFSSLSGFWSVSAITIEPTITEKIIGKINTTNSLVDTILL